MSRSLILWGQISRIGDITLSCQTITAGVLCTSMTPKGPVPAYEARLPCYVAMDLMIYNSNSKRVLLEILGQAWQSGLWTVRTKSLIIDTTNQYNHY